VGELVNSVKARKLESGLIQVITAVLIKLSETGVLEREDAFEYLAGNIDAWRGPAGVALADDDEAEPGEESLEQLVEKLDAMVFGLVEALDSDSSALPRLLDEALTGSLWARQIAKREDDLAAWQKSVLQSRAALIWSHTTPQTRRGHFAMGVGLDAGLVLDAMADDLAGLVDAADLAAIQSDAETLGDSLVELAQRILVIRPFTPDRALPGGWEATLRAWVGGADVADIGGGRMKSVEDVFAYKLVWALEAIRTRRMTLGWEPDIVAGGGAAALETGVPSFMAAMLIRAGLPSRRAAMAAVGFADAAFFDLEGMKLWLECEEIEGLSHHDGWPAEGVEELWRRFRTDALGSGSPTWRRSTVLRRLSPNSARPADGRYRLEIDPVTRTAWVLSGDFRRMAAIGRRVTDGHAALYKATFVAGDNRAHVERLGPGKPIWDDAP
jgi:hypothetical protein